MSAKKTNAKMPEFLRKFFVALKRRPSIIALVALVVAFLIYSLNLTYISNTTAKIQGPGMGLCGFATMLFSLLSMVCFLNAFPRRKKPVVVMVVVMFCMFAVIIFCDVHYMGLIENAIHRADNPIKLDASTAYIAKAYNMLMDHIIVECIGVALILLMPLYTKLLRKINTSVTVEDYGKLGAIDISGED